MEIFERNLLILEYLENNGNEWVGLSEGEIEKLERQVKEDLRIGLHFYISGKN